MREFSRVLSYTQWHLLLLHLSSTRLDPPLLSERLILCGMDLTRWGKHSGVISVLIEVIASHRYCRFVDCTCGGYLSTVNSLLCLSTLRWFDLCRKTVILPEGRDGHCEQQYSGTLWHVNDDLLVLRQPECDSVPLYNQQHQPLIKGRKDPSFHVVYSKFCLYHLKITAEMETRTR